MLLSIGELSDRTGRTTALRYYDELGLAAGGSGGGTTAFCRVGSQGLILFIREIGFSLAEIAHFIFGERQSQRDMIDHKLAELAEQQHRIEVARIALEQRSAMPSRRAHEMLPILVDHRTRCETVHRPIAGVSTDDQAVSDADRRPTTTDEIGAVVPSNRATTDLDPASGGTVSTAAGQDQTQPQPRRKPR